MRKSQIINLLAAIIILITTYHHITSRTEPHMTVPVEAQNPPPKPVPTTADYRIPVLMYHHIGPIAPEHARNRFYRNLTVSAEDFRQQMHALHEAGYTFISTRQIAQAIRRGTPLPIKAAAVTIDDGYQDAYTSAFPIMQEYHIPATIFVTAGVLDTPEHITEDQMKEMIEAGIICESHTLHHPDLTIQTPHELNYELRESKTRLQKKFGVPITSIAYPAGAQNPRVTAAAKNAGYTTGWTTKSGPIHPGIDPYLLPRVRVSGYMTLKEFLAAVRS